MVVELTHSPITRKAIRRIAAELRGVDRQEIEAMYGEDCDVQSILEHHAMSTVNSRVVEWDGYPVAVVGCEPSAHGAGCPWMMGTRALREIPLQLTREAIEMVGQWRYEFKYLINTVWSESKSVPWLRRIGFVISDTPAFVVEETEEEFVWFFMGGLT